MWMRFEHGREGIGLAVDPEIHGVGHDEFGRRHLIEHFDLQRRMNVAEQDVGRIEVGLGELGAKIGEHVELRFERDATDEVRVIAPGPAERLARGALEAGQIDAAPRQRFEVFRREVFADHGHQAHR
jgi:hypothetical protein